MELRFSVLGPVTVLRDGVDIDLGPVKQRALLAALLLRRGRVASRAGLVDAVWGEEPPASAANALQVYVHGLRRALGTDRIETVAPGYRLIVEDDELDLDRFERLLARGRRELSAGDAARGAADLRAALDLWQDDALADLAGEPVAAEAGHLGEQRLVALELRLEADLASGRHDELLAELEAEVARHPDRDTLQRQYALALYRAGRQVEALERLRAGRAELLDRFGLEPSEETRELERAILQQDPSLAAPAGDRRAPLRLPAPATPLVGRQGELSEVLSLLSGDARLVTLTGSGGIGKTRLALAAAENVRAAGTPAGFVDLSAIADPELVASAIAEAVGATLTGADDVADLAADLDARGRVLLVIDNLEQLMDAGELISHLLSRVPALTVLATSRVPLALAAEHRYEVAPLATDESTELFMARARATDPRFAAGEDAAATVNGLCTRLDGVPLAIELAAGRVGHMTLQRHRPAAGSGARLAGRWPARRTGAPPNPAGDPRVERCRAVTGGAIGLRRAVAVRRRIRPRSGACGVRANRARSRLGTSRAGRRQPRPPLRAERRAGAVRDAVYDPVVRRRAAGRSR